MGVHAHIIVVHPGDINFKAKSLRVWHDPFRRIDSNTCALFHLPHNRKLHPHHKLNNLCASCKKLSNEILQIKKRCDTVTTEVKLQRQMPNSRYPLSLLSPTSLDIRNRCVISERKALKRKVERYVLEWKNSLDDDQSLQLAKIMQIIEEKYEGDLQKIFNEAEQNNKCLQLQKEWNQDKEDHLNFWEDQVGNGNSSFVV